MRSEFEKLPEIAELLNDKEKEFFYNEDFEVYGTSPVNDFDAGFINGAWMAYQEQQKLINMQECGAREIQAILNDSKCDDAVKLKRIKELLK